MINLTKKKRFRFDEITADPNFNNMKDHYDIVCPLVVSAHHKYVKSLFAWECPTCQRQYYRRYLEDVAAWLDRCECGKEVLAVRDKSIECEGKESVFSIYKQRAERGLDE